MRALSSCARGFSLVESVVACALLTVGVLSLAHLFAIAVSMNVAAKHATMAAILAAQKLEELRTSIDPLPGADFIDARGSVLPLSGDVRPSEAAYLRRWTVDPLAVDPATSVALQVIVTPIVAPGPGRADVRLVSVRWRRP